MKPLLPWLRAHRWHLLGAAVLVVLGALVAGQLGAGAAAAIAAALATARGVARRRQGEVEAAVAVERVNAQRDGIEARAAEVVREGDRAARAAEAPPTEPTPVTRGEVDEALARWARSRGDR